jgi:hypothetical protein
LRLSGTNCKHVLREFFQFLWSFQAIIAIWIRIFWDVAHFLSFSREPAFEWLNDSLMFGELTRLGRRELEFETSVYDIVELAPSNGSRSPRQPLSTSWNCDDALETVSM